MKIIVTESQLNYLLEFDLENTYDEGDEPSAKSVEWARKFKTDLGLTNAAAAAMAANIEHESSFLSDKIQNGFGPNTGTLNQSGGGGYSWAQWTFGKRKKAFRNYVKKNFGVDINKTPATDSQAYSFLKYELQNPKNTLYDNEESLKYHNLDLETFKKNKDVGSATEEFVTKYEMAGKPATEKRKKIAKKIYNNLVNGTTPTPVVKTPTVKTPTTNTTNKVYYTVKSGDSLSKIAAQYDSSVTVESIKKLNNLTSDSITPDQVLRIK
jgi:LysM repeat protein